MTKNFMLLIIPFTVTQVLFEITYHIWPNIYVGHYFIFQGWLAAVWYYSRQQLKWWNQIKPQLEEHQKLKAAILKRSREQARKWN